MLVRFQIWESFVMPSHPQLHEPARFPLFWGVALVLFIFTTPLYLEPGTVDEVWGTFPAWVTSALIFTTLLSLWTFFGGLVLWIPPDAVGMPSFCWLSFSNWNPKRLAVCFFDHRNSTFLAVAAAVPSGGYLSKHTAVQV